MITYRRVLLPVEVDGVRVEVEPEDVLDEDEPEDVRVDAAGAAVRVLLVDSRLMVVVRPLASVLLMIVRVVPDLLTRLSIVVEGAAVRVEDEPEDVRAEVVEKDVRVEVVDVDVEVDVDAGEDVRPEVVVADEVEPVRVDAEPEVVRVEVEPEAVRDEDSDSGLEARRSVSSRSWPALRTFTFEPLRDCVTRCSKASCGWRTA